MNATHLCGSSSERELQLQFEIRPNEINIQQKCKKNKVGKKNQKKKKKKIAQDRNICKAKFNSSNFCLYRIDFHLYFSGGVFCVLVNSR